MPDVQDSYYQGADAYYEGEALKNNPYGEPGVRTNTERCASQWYTGWIHAQRGLIERETNE